MPIGRIKKLKNKKSAKDYYFSVLSLYIFTQKPLTPLYLMLHWVPEKRCKEIAYTLGSQFLEEKKHFVVFLFLSSKASQFVSAIREVLR